MHALDYNIYDQQFVLCSVTTNLQLKDKQNNIGVQLYPHRVYKGIPINANKLPKFIDTLEDSVYQGAHLAVNNHWNGMDWWTGLLDWTANLTTKSGHNMEMTTSGHNMEMTASGHNMEMTASGKSLAINQKQWLLQWETPREWLLWIISIYCTSPGGYYCI